MAQPQVTWIGYNSLDYTITVAFHDRRAEFFIKPDLFRSALYKVKTSIENKWFNAALSLLVTHSNALHYQGETYDPQSLEMIIPPWNRRENMGNRLPEPTDFSKTPSAEYPFTLIAPTAKSGLIYQGQRYWHKTEAAATEYATYIYDANPTEKFDLVVVKALTQIRPKPMVELQSTSFVGDTDSKTSSGT
jgi:hypothetical protein